MSFGVTSNSDPLEWNDPMTDKILARKLHGAAARIVREIDLLYLEGASDEHDRPPHVRAASGLAPFKEYLVVIQDDANWLAVIDDAERVHALPLPQAPGSGARVFGSDRGNKHEKFDLEACISVSGQGGHEFIGFGSGSHPGKEWILRVHESAAIGGELKQRATHDRLGLDVTAEFMNAEPFYDTLRATKAFSGAGLNIEGAVLLDDGHIRFFQRGNAPSQGGLEPVDATGDVRWDLLARHLADPDRVPPPGVHNIRQYSLGVLDGVGLTFSDAERLPGGCILYSASAEDPATDAIKGSALGVIEPDGSACWGLVENEDGSYFEGKIEGLSLHPSDGRTARFVIDDDDEAVPSKLYEARLSTALLDRGR